MLVILLFLILLVLVASVDTTSGRRSVLPLVEICQCGLHLYNPARHPFCHTCEVWLMDEVAEYNALMRRPQELDEVDPYWHSHAPCEQCHGTGEDCTGDWECSACDGTGAQQALEPLPPELPEDEIFEQCQVCGNLDESVLPFHRVCDACLADIRCYANGTA